MPEKFRSFWPFFLSVRFRSIHERKKIKSQKVARFAHSPWLAALNPRRIDKKKKWSTSRGRKKGGGEKKWEIGFSQCCSGSSCLQGHYLYCCLWSLFYSWRFFGFFSQNSFRFFRLIWILFIISIFFISLVEFVFANFPFFFQILFL